MTVKIIADSTCDLPAELVDKYQIAIQPLHIIMDGKSFDDGITCCPEDIYSWSDATKSTPTTSAPSLMEVMNTFEKYYRDYDELVCFTISSSMSSSFNVFRMAAEEMEISERVYIIDSQNLCTGIALMIVKAAEMAQQGTDGENIYRTICDMRPKIRSSFVLDTLTFLQRGGRCSSIASIAGSALKLHPMIIVEDGKMHSVRKYRGNMERVYLQYVEDLDEQLRNADTDRVFLTHSGISQQDIDRIRELLQSRYEISDIILATAGGVISSHCGPGAMGVMFMEK